MISAAMKLRYTPLVQGFGEAWEVLLGALVVSCPSMLIFMELCIGFLVVAMFFNFEREQFQTIAPPSYFGPLEKQFSDCLKLGVLEGCLVLCVFGDDSSKFVMWVMREYGIRESWTKTLVIKNLYPRELSCDLYEPMVFLRNGEIVMSYNDWAVVCYNQKRMSLRETRINQTRNQCHAIGYSPCFVSLYNVSRA